MKQTSFHIPEWNRSRVWALLSVLFAFGLQASAGEFKFKEIGEASLGLWEGEKPVFVYNYGVIRKAGVPADRARSTYFHPLYGLDGEVLTDDFPEDHYHHRGLFWAWPHVKVGNKETDLWMLKGVEQRFERWLERDINAERAVLSIQNGWYIADRSIMDERVTVTVKPADSVSRSIDLEFVWTPTEEPVTLAGAEGKSYGGLTMRFAPRTKTLITTPVGNDSADLPMTRLAWADLSAQFTETQEPSGAAIFVPETHPDFPPMWLTRHYGVLCLGWPGVDPLTFPAGKAVRCAYRVWIHRGTASGDQLRAAYEKYNGQSPRVEVGKNMFFAFDNGVERGQKGPREQARLLKELGYDGISYSGIDELEERHAALEGVGLRVYALYVPAFVDQAKPFEPGLPEAIKKLKGKDTVIWLTVQGGTGAADDSVAVEVVQKVADMAKESGLRVALYPHKGFYVATAEDALRLVKAAKKKNLGLTLNLCHELMAGTQDRFPQIIKAVAPHLYLVSINGANTGTTVEETIQVLGEGNYDVLEFLRMLDRAGYGGPIGLQCYNVPGDARENLRRSMQAWRHYVEERCRPTGP